MSGGKAQPGGVQQVGEEEEEQGEALAGEQGEIGACLPASREVGICDQGCQWAVNARSQLCTRTLSLSLRSFLHWKMQLKNRADRVGE